MLEAREALSAKQTTSEFQANDKVTSLEALDCFEHINFPDLGKFDVTRPENNAKIDIGGVDVSVNPDVIFRGVYRNKNIVGAVKLHIVKTALNEEARKTVATVLHQFVEDLVKADDEIVPVECIFSLDVFSHKCESAPKSYKRRRTDVQAACEEYALWWNRI